MEARFRHLIASRKEIMPTLRCLRTIKEIWMGVRSRRDGHVAPRWSDVCNAQYGLTTCGRLGSVVQLGSGRRLRTPVIHTLPNEGRETAP